MSPGTSGLERDLRLVRRRAWLFIPFFVLGILVSLFLGRSVGDANAVATMQLETVIHELFIGGDRGLRIFEAEAMTGDEAFRAKVLEAAGDANLDYARFSIALQPISIADGVSRGTLVVSIKDPEKAEAERLRAAFVSVFEREYREPGGLFRTRFVQLKQAVADSAEAQYQAALAELKPLAEAKGLPLDEVLRSDQQILQSLRGELNVQTAGLDRQLAEVNGALRAIGSQQTPAAAAAASAALGEPVSAADAAAALQARKATLEDALRALRARQASIADTTQDPRLVALLDRVRALARLKEDAHIRLGNATLAVESADSTIDTTLSGSGGVAATPIGRVAVVLGFTLVFGLIAIYALEWLAQVRAGSPA